MFHVEHIVMTAKSKKTKVLKTRTRKARVGLLHGSVEDELLSLANGEAGADLRWNRPRKCQGCGLAGD